MDSRKVADWRRKVNDNVRNTDGRRVEAGVITEAHHSGWDKADADQAGNAVLEKPAAEKPREGRETVGIIAKSMSEMMMRLRANDPEAFRRKVEEMQQMGALSHLTLEDACNEIDRLVRKVSEMEVAQVYEQMGLSHKA